MRNIIFAFFISLFSLTINHAQTGWTWTELSAMPKRISNNAVVEGFVGNNAFVYSFSGIDSTKTHQGINLGSYKYDVQNDTWTTIAPLPDTMGKVAAGASFVNGRIYIIGGYHVLANGGEVSSDKVHVYNPVTDAYESDATAIPVPIDDQVQCVWRDSLIFVITGWSNTGNKPDVQIYNPYTDTWQVGTDVPNNNAYISFGASGTIIGDTIIYNGGVSGSFSFSSRNYTRIGVIDPNDPTQITWSQTIDNPGEAGYRMASSHYENLAFWVGGGGVAYNYDGLAYSNGAGVEPLERILQFKNDTHQFDEGLGTPFGIMDLRGIAKISDTEWIISGGMETGQSVSNRTFKIEIDPIAASVAQQVKEIKIYPNPASNYLTVSEDNIGNTFSIVDLTGREVLTNSITSTQINVATIQEGVYIFVLKNQEGVILSKAKFEKR